MKDIEWQRSRSYSNSLILQKTYALGNASTLWVQNLKSTIDYKLKIYIYNFFWTYFLHGIIAPMEQGFVRLKTCWVYKMTESHGLSHRFCDGK